MKPEKYILEEATKMQLLNKKVLKNGQVTQSSANKEIITKIEEKKIEEVIAPELSISTPEAMKIAINYQTEVRKLEKIKSETLAEIREQSKQIEADAYQKGFIEGQEAGRESGYRQGIEQAKVEAKQYIEEAKNNLFDADFEIKTMIREQKLELVKFSVALAEQLTETIIDTKETVIAEKIGNFIENIDYPKELIIVRVHEKQIATVREFIESKKADWHHVRITVLKGTSLTQTNYSVETDDDFTLFDLKAELSNFMDELVKDDME